MTSHKLLALNYANSDTFNREDENQFRSMIVWLEDQKVRHYKIEDRAGLHALDNADVWNKALSHYLTELQCPYNVNDGREEVLDWLLGYAVRLEYGDNIEKYKPKTADSSDSKTNNTSSNPLDNIDFNSADVKAGIVSLSQLLRIPPHPDHLEVLKAICLVVRDKLSAESIEKAKKDIGKRDFVGLDTIQLGFDCGDTISNDAAKILRLLQIHSLRDLQTQINAAIVAVQAITANPKTDTRLGKVGR